MISTTLKNISQNGKIPQVGVKLKNIWNLHLDYIASDYQESNPL